MDTVPLAEPLCLGSPLSGYSPPPAVLCGGEKGFVPLFRDRQLNVILLLI